MPILEGEKVTKQFGGLIAVSNVDFQVEQGETLGLIGPNGAGKTTLFNLISGALTLTSGRIILKGEDITHLRPNQICKRRISRTFQLGNLFAKMTVFENVLLGALFGTSGRISAVNAQREAMELLEFVGLSEKENFLAKELPTAAQKRLELARALATKPELLFLDEVMAGLTPTEIAQALDLIRKIRDKGITVIIIEHVMKVIMGISDRIMVLHHGEKIAEGTPGEIATSKTVIKVYLGQ
jgi:branched-chain amino acid transport system ATP-binding protein